MTDSSLVSGLILLAFGAMAVWQSLRPRTSTTANNPEQGEQ